MLAAHFDFFLSRVRIGQSKNQNKQQQQKEGKATSPV